MMRKTAFLLIVVLFVTLGFSSIAMASQPRTRLTFISPNPKSKSAINHKNIVFRWRIKSKDPIEELAIYIENMDEGGFREIPVEPKNQGHYSPKAMKPGTIYFWGLNCKTTKKEGGWGPFMIKTK